MTDLKFFIFDNGSAGSTLLKDEYKDAQVVKVSGKDLVENFTKFDQKEYNRILLPFTVEDLVANNEQLRKDIGKLKQLGFNNLIVLPYEGNDAKTIEYKAKNLGESLKGEVKIDEKKPYTTVRTADNKEV